MGGWVMDGAWTRTTSVLTRLDGLVSLAMYTVPTPAVIPSRLRMLCSTAATADSSALATSQASCQGELGGGGERDAHK
jgi:hypothetical protein